jgi:hypothetical protein
MVSNRDRLDQICRYAQGLLPAEEAGDLEAALREGADLRRDFLEYLNVDAALAEHAALPEGKSVGPCAARHVGWRLGPRLFLAAAAVLFVATVAVWLDRSAHDRTQQQSVVLAEVLSDERAEFEGRTASVHQGDRLTVSRLRLKQGALRLRLPSGVVLELSGPAQGAFESPMRFRLARGSLNVDVGKRGRGFTVVTGAGEITDLGTRFGVTVNPGGQTDVAVFSGEVRIRERGMGVVTISEGEALRLHAGRQADRLFTVPLKRDKTTMNTAGPAPAVASVTDNIEDSEFRRFYGIVAGGMGPGTLVYTDKYWPRWQPVEGEVFPPELLGADVVQTFHNDRHELDLKISLHVVQPSAIYVMHDARKPPLDWLERGFEDTGLRVRSGPWKLAPAVWDLTANSRGEVYVEYTVWRAYVPAGGRIELGPPHVVGEGGDKVMFGIAVKPLDLNTDIHNLTRGGL